jgi:ferric-dicitrate binding protein FerR (iron transport regulator)
VDIRLLKKYFENNCSPKEVREVLHWIEQTDASKEVENEFSEVWRKIKVKPGDYSRWEQKLEKIHERIEMETLYDSLELDRNNVFHKRTKDRLPISGKERYHLTRKGNLKFIFPGILIAFLIAAAMFYWVTPQKALKAIPDFVQKEKSTDPGQKLSFHLDDGTRVLLNSGSRISYPASFDSLERKVILEGEAFFDVSKENNRPFKVVTESFVTTALGTSFNISACKNGEIIEVALVTGKVSVGRLSQGIDSKSLILNPGEMVTVEKRTNTLLKTSFDFNEKIAWKDGIIVFNEATYREFTMRLEDWYGVDITSNVLPGKKWEFTGKFENETLENILLGLQFGHNFEYSIDGKDVKLKF